VEPNPRHDWIAGDPSTWTGRKIRNKKTGAIFRIGAVFQDGTVELESDGEMAGYRLDLATIRSRYEPDQ